MSTTTTTHETISDVQQANTAFERSGSYYGYLGEDGDGYHHHIDEVTNTIYVTDEPYQRTLPAGAAIYRITLYGNVNHIEDLNLHDDKDLSDWVAYIDSKRGWAERPTDITEALQRALAAVVQNKTLEGNHQ